MSACSRTARILARTRIHAVRTQLPFLYQTQTIQLCSHSALPLARRHTSSWRGGEGRSEGWRDEDGDIPFEGESASPGGGSGSGRGRYERDVPFESDVSRLRRGGVPFETDSIPFETDSIPFEGGDALPPALDDLGSGRKTTMTGAERKAFEKLYKTFKTQNRTHGNRGPGEEDDQVADEYYEDDDDGSAKSVDAIFEEVFKELPVKKMGTVDQVESLAKRLEREVSKIAAQMPAEDSEEVARLKRLRRIEHDRVQQLLRNAQTDVELWDVLERECFAPIRALNLDGQGLVAGVASAPASNKGKNSKKGKKKGKNQANTTPPPSEDPPVSTPASIPPGPRRSTTNTTPPLPASVPSDHQILFRNYPLHVTHAAGLFNKLFPSSPLLLSLLPTIKSLGRTSYALGVTPSLYSHLLRCAWRQQASYTLLDTLLTEMSNSAIDFDAAAEETLRLVVAEFDDARQGKLGREAQIVFGMERFVVGIAKIREWRVRVREALAAGQGAETQGERGKEGREVV